MKFSTAALFAIGLLAGNVVSAPTLQGSDVTLPIEVRAEDFVANDAAHLEARAKKKAKGGKAKGGKAKGGKAKAAGAKAKGAAAKKTAGKKNNAGAAANTNNNANAAKATATSQAAFAGLACTDGKGAGSCNAQGQCAVNGKTTQIAGQCGVAAKKDNKRSVSVADITHLI